MRFIVCPHPSEYIEVLFSVLVHLPSSVQLCVQRVLNRLYEALEVVVLLEKHRGRKLLG